VTARADDIVAVPIWTTTPWTLPASIAVTLGAELDYVLIEGPARGGKRLLLVVAEALLEKIGKRYNVENAAVLGRVKGAALASLPPLAGEGAEGGWGQTTLRHPFYAREIPIILGDHVSAE